jgi:3-oxoacyl-[acyl-carrier protein] reductase
MGLLSGQSAIVTGAAAGIGEATAKLFASEGARVALFDINAAGAEAVAAGIRAAGGTALAVAGDVRSAVDVASLVSRTLQEYGRIDALINNAGIYPRCSFVEMTDEKWDEILSVNLKGVYRVTRQVVPPMLAQGGGRIVNISSVTFHVGMAQLTHYVASKGALIGFTRSLARELGPQGIRVNCITPGAVETETDRLMSTPEEDAAVVALQSLPRRIQPLDIARVCVFLCSSLSDGMTGQTLNVDGGWMMY